MLAHQQMKKSKFFFLFLKNFERANSNFFFLDRKPLYIPIPIPIPVPIYVPVPMAMYNFPSPFPVAFPVPVVTPIVFPFGSNLLTEMMKAIADAKKKETENGNLSENGHLAVHSLVDKTVDANDVTNNPVQDLVAEQVDSIGSAEDFELEIPSCSILSFRNGSRKRSHSTSHFPLPVPKRLKDIDCSRSSSDSEESTRTSRSDSPSLHLKGIPLYLINSVKI